jgi:large subunit ribosomal protein L15
VHTGKINEIFEDGEEVSKDKLFEKRLVRRKKLPIKLLVKGDITKKFIVDVDKASVNAIKMVEDKGGKVVLLSNER